MGGKGGGGDSGDTFVPQNQAMQLAQQAPAAQRAAAARLGTPYQPPTPQELQDARNRDLMKARANRRAPINPAVDPNAIAGSGMGSDVTLGDVAAQSVAPERAGRRNRKGPPMPPPNTGSV